MNRQQPKTTVNEVYIGLMSGTSIDAIDAVVVDFTDQRPKLLATHKLLIEQHLREELLNLCHPGHDEINRMGKLDFQLGELFADASNAVLNKSGLTTKDIRAIGSHGQTIRHHPRGDYPFTLQIGDPNRIAEKTGITTVCDFRRRDLTKNGQGAPLVPAFHAKLFQSENQNRVILNIGGIANISILPANSNAIVTGFDPGPGNILMDAWTQEHLNKPFDENGLWAATGKVIPDLLFSLLNENYFDRKPPKSSGRELFNLAWVQKHLEGLSASYNPEDVQATLLELTAQTISQAIQEYAPQSELIIVCGGGVYNVTLMQRLKQLNPISIQSTDEIGIAPDWIEAMAFAWLAQQTLSGNPGNLPSVTGANGPAVLGGVYK